MVAAIVTEWPDYSKWFPAPRSWWEALRMRRDQRRGLPYQERIMRVGERRGQSTFAWCQKCGSDLRGNPDTVCIDADFVYYTCGWCHDETTWDFDSYPVPVRLK